VLCEGRSISIEDDSFNMQAHSTRATFSPTLRCALLILAFFLCASRAFASGPAESVPETALPDAPSALRPAAAVAPGPGASLPLEQQDHPPVTVFKLPLNIARDGINILVSPAYLRTNDLKWLLPLAGASAAAFATDTHTMTQVVSTNPSFNQTSSNVSDGLRDGFIAAPIAMFGLGYMHQNDHMKETGLLGSEAMIDAVIVDEVVKLGTFRERPQLDSAQGEFYVGRAGADSSFVSGHSMIAWSSSAVIAGEYHSRWVQAAVYTLAAGVSATRVLGQQHFPSDVLLGSAGGWLIGHYVFRAHHHGPLNRSTK